MVLDIGPILRRLILGASPLLVAGCDHGGCGEGDIKPRLDETFDLVVVVFEDDSFTVRSGRPTPPTPPGIDWGTPPPDAGSGLRGMFMPIELRAAYDKCARLRGFSCADFCRQITQLQFRSFEVESCEAVEGGPPDRPKVRIAGLGTNALCGRRPPAVRFGAAQEGADPVGEYLADCAALEAASIHAFHLVARELAGHGAPGELPATAVASARDEVRHAVAMDLLAARHRRRPPAVRLGATRPRSLVDLARDNAAEGCVRETYGAVVAHLQARAAADPLVRAVMAGIAEDETRHASLAWSIDRWAATRMDRAGRRAAAAARAAAVHELRTEAARPVSPALVHALGLPDAPTATALVDELADTLLDLDHTRRSARGRCTEHSAAVFLGG